MAWVQGFATALGGPGLFVIGYLDSSFLSFPEVNDLLVISMVMQHPARLIYYALMATLGSVAGCVTLYFIARKGGEAFMRKRFKAHHIEGGLKLFQKHGLLRHHGPGPPAPARAFQDLHPAGRGRRNPAWQFVTAVFIARGIRYGGEGLLAVWYGERAVTFLTTRDGSGPLARGRGARAGRRLDCLAAPKACIINRLRLNEP